MRFLSWLSLLFVLLIPLAVHAQSESDIDAAKAVLSKFVNGDFAGIYAQCSDQIKAAAIAMAWFRSLSRPSVIQWVEVSAMGQLKFFCLCSTT